MLRLVKAELFKLFKNKTFRVLCIVSVALSLLMLFMSSPIMNDIMMDSLGSLPEDQKEVVMAQLNSSGKEEVFTAGQLGFHLTAKDPMNPTALEVYHSSFGSGAIEVLIGILIAAIFAKEYSEGTIKNTLAYGKKRWEFYIAKFAAMVVGIAVILVLLTSISTMGSIFMNGWGQTFEMSQVIDMTKSFVVAIIANSAVAAILMIVAIIVKSNGGTIGITVAIFILIPTVLGFMYGIYPAFDTVYEFTPFYNSTLATSIYSSGSDLLRSAIIAMVTIVLSLLVGINIFKRQDIK